MQENAACVRFPEQAFVQDAHALTDNDAEGIGSDDTLGRSLEEGPVGFRLWLGLDDAVDDDVSESSLHRCAPARSTHDR
jgi:hypothetical protein